MLEVIQPGPFTTVQDCGRRGYQRYGVSVTGVMDRQSHILANLLVGNEPQEATFEITFSGAKFKFHRSTTIAIAGADMTPLINGEPIHTGRPVFIPSGSELHFSKMKSGCRTYLAVTGGWDIPSVLKSKSTFLRAGIGGFKGRALCKGDEIAYSEQSLAQHNSEDWHVSSDRWWKRGHVRVIKGPESNQFTSEQLKQFTNFPYKVSPQSDRMGYRLQGEGIKKENSLEMISEPVTFGTIQLPSDGQPIILMADRQTTGGYPRIGQVIEADLCILAQKKPGETIQFEWVDIEQARMLSKAVHQWMKEVDASIALRRKQDAE
ncbi:biotin-dependent carboxyltransferase family protein [Chryseomicrobium imtechense]